MIVRPKTIELVEQLAAEIKEAQLYRVGELWVWARNKGTSLGEGGIKLDHHDRAVLYRNLKDVIPQFRHEIISELYLACWAARQ